MSEHRWHLLCGASRIACHAILDFFSQTLMDVLSGASAAACCTGQSKQCNLHKSRLCCSLVESAALSCMIGSATSLCAARHPSTKHSACAATVHVAGLKLTAQMRPPCDALACSVTSVAAGGFSGLIIMMDAAAAVPVTQSCIFHQQGTGDAKQEPPRSSKGFFGCHT